MAEARAIVPIDGIRPGLNAETADLAKNVFVSLTGTAEDPPEVELPTAGGPVYGVVFSSSVRVDVSPDVGIVDGEIGDIQVKGRAIVIAAGAIPIGSLVMTDGNGAALVATATNTPVGTAVTVGVDTELVEIELAGPGVGGELNA